MKKILFILSVALLTVGCNDKEEFTPAKGATPINVSLTYDNASSFASNAMNRTLIYEQNGQQIKLSIVADEDDAQTFYLSAAVLDETKDTQLLDCEITEVDYAVNNIADINIASIPDDGAFQGQVLLPETTELQEAMAKHRPNDKVNITVKRKGELKHFEVLLRNKAGEAKLLDKNSIDVKAVLGGTFAPISSKAKRSLRIDNGIQVTEVGNGLLKKSGIREGYIITHINGNPIKEVSDLDRLTDPIQSIDGLYPNGRYVSYSIIND